MANLKDRITLENLMEQALKIPKVKVDRAAFLQEAFAKEGILVRQIVEEGPVACDYSDIELDAMAEKLILRRTSTSSAMSFAAGIPGGLAVAATIPADTLQFFAMSLKLAQELAYLYGAKDFWACDGEDSVLVRYQLICSLGAMFGITGAPAATRLLSSHLALRAVGGTPQRATTREFWDPIVRRISRELVLRLTTDTASKGVAKLIPVIGGFFSGGMTFFAMKPMGEKLCQVLSTAAFLYSDSFAMKDYLVLEEVCEKSLKEELEEECADESASNEVAGDDGWGPMPTTGEVAPDDGWGPMPELTGKSSDKASDKADAKDKSKENDADKPQGKDAGSKDNGGKPLTNYRVPDEKGNISIPISFGEDSDSDEGSLFPIEDDHSDVSCEEPAIDESVPIDGDDPAPIDGNGSGSTDESKAAPQAAAAAPMTMDEIFATIEKLAVLRDKGAITQEDFDAKKAELLARI